MAALLLSLLGTACQERTGLVIVCVGDSATFGVYERDERVPPGTVRGSFPGHLERLLAEQVPGGPHRVINLGITGVTSQDVAVNLERNLEKHRPDALVVLAGVNDPLSWTPAGTLRYGVDESLVPPLMAESTVMLSSEYRQEPREEDPGVEVFGRDHEGETFRFVKRARKHAFGPEPRARRLRESVERMSAIAERHGVNTLWLTYPGEGERFSMPNATLREVCPKLPGTFVDVAPWVSNLIEAAGMHRIRYPDEHLRSPGNELVARLIFNGLVEAGVLAGPSPVDPMEGVLGTGDEVEVELVGSLDELESLGIRVRGEEPGATLMLMLSGSGPGDWAERDGMILPIFDDGLFAQSLLAPQLIAPVDETGEAFLPLAALLPEDRAARFRGRQLLVCYVVIDRGQPRWFSDAFELRLE